MTVADTLKAIEVMQAFASGKQIQVKSKGEKTWHTIANDGSETPAWAWQKCTYRVKPVPRKPQDIFVTGGLAFESRANAEKYGNPYGYAVTHYREVLPS